MPLFKKYTVHLVPTNSDEPVKKFALDTGKLVTKISALTVVLIMAVTLLAYYGFKDNKANQRLAEISADYTRLKDLEKQLLVILEQLPNMKMRMAHLQDSNFRIRMMAGIEQPSHTSRFLNVGGSTGAGTQLIAALEKGTDYTAAMVEEQLDQMDRSLALEESRMIEVYEYLKDQQSYLTAVPSMQPTEGWLSSGFGYRISPFTGARQLHEGIDLATQEGRPVIVPADGVVLKSTWNGGFGRVVVVEHGYGFKTVYAHLSKSLVKKGDKVKRGDKIALVGNSGRSTGPHLHYEVHLNNVPVNPLNFILN